VKRTAKCPEMFATIVIVLPSRFTGGSLHLSHGGRTKLVDLASTSSMTTSELAWYTDIYQVLDPILSGYRLTLSYTLSFPTSAGMPKSMLPKTEPIIQAFRHAMLSWRQCGIPDEGITKLVCLLDHQYPKMGLRGDNLKGSDEYVLGLLQPIVDQLGFQMYLANLQLNVPYYSGAQQNSHSHDHGSWRRHLHDVKRIKIKKVTKLRDLHTVDMCGIPVRIKEFKIDPETELITGTEDKILDERDCDSYVGALPSPIIIEVDLK
jgi:hypothetical protein